MNKPVYVYDFTIWHDQHDDRDQLIGWLRENAKHWTFQLEKSETSQKLHWQGRLSLIKKKRLGELLTSWPYATGSKVSATSSQGSKTFQYGQKADTRVEGPWTDKDEEPVPLTKQLRVFNERGGCSEWMRELIDMIKDFDLRHIHVVVDKEGNSGKSLFAEYCEYHKIAYELPPMNSMEDMMQCVMGTTPKKCYFIDMPRAMKKDKLAGFYAGIEALKNGVAYDKRYAFKKRRFDRPNIVVFTNDVPDKTLLSPDRWVVYILRNGALVPEEAAVA